MISSKSLSHYASVYLELYIVKGVYCVMEVASSVQDDLAQIAANTIGLVQGSYKLLKSECSS